MSLRRVHDWPGRLEAVLSAAARTPFAWGQADCMLFVSDCIEAMTGVDPAAPFFRGRYATEIGARRKMREFAGGGVLATMVKRFERELGCAPIPPGYAKRGDLILVTTEHGEMGGIMGLDGVHVVLRDYHGLQTVPRATAHLAWHIGDI